MDTIYNRIYNEDILTCLRRLPDKSVDLFVPDPPYYDVVNENWDKQWKSMNAYLEWCDEWIAEIGRTSKYSGSLWIFGFPYQLTRLIPIVEKYGFKFRQQIVLWKGIKSAAGRVSSKLKMYPTTSESVFFFAYDSQPIIKQLLNDQKNKLQLTSKAINEYLGKATTGGGTWSTIAGLKQTHTSLPTKEDWNRLNILFGNTLPPYDDYVFKFNLKMGLTDVWDDINFTPKGEKRIHPTQKPLKLIERIVTTSSKDSDLVVDPFMGSGTTAIASINTNRSFYGCELDLDYYTKLATRIKNHKKKQTAGLLEF